MKMDRTVSAMQVRYKFGAILNEVFYNGDTITIERDGKPMAAIVPLSHLEARRKAMRNLKAIAEENHELNKDVSAEVIEQEIFEAIKEVRQGK